MFNVGYRIINYFLQLLYTFFIRFIPIHFFREWNGGDNKRSDLVEFPQAVKIELRCYSLLFLSFIHLQARDIEKSEGKVIKFWREDWCL